MIKKIESFSSQTQIIFLLFVTFLFRLLGINARPIWYDEAFSILFSSKGINAMLLGTLAQTGAGAADIHPLGYYSILWIWMKVFGESLFSVRLLSVFAGMGVVFLLYQIGIYLFDKKTAFLAGLFAAIAPFQIHYAQEIRMYAFLAFWLLLALYAFLKGIKEGKPRWVMIFSFSVALAQYTHNLAVFFLIPLALTPFVLKDKKMILRIVFAGVLAIFLYLPWLVHIPSQFNKVKTSYWVAKPGFERIVTLLLSYVTNLPLPDNWLLPALLSTFLPIGMALWQTFSAVGRKKTGAWRGIWLLYLSFAPPLLLFIVSEWVPVFIERALLPSGTVFCLWLAWALFETKLPHFIQAILTGFLLLGAGMGIYQHLNYADFPYVPKGEMVQFLNSHYEIGDAIVHSNKLTALPVVYYAPALPQEYIADVAGSSTDTLAFATQETLGLFAQPNTQSAVIGAQRVWFILFEKSIREYQEAGQETHPHIAWLKENYFLEDVRNWEGIRVYLFSKEQ